MPQPFVTLIRQPAVAERFGIGRSLLYRWVQLGLLPNPVKLGTRAAAWPDAEIAALVVARTAGATADEIKALVAELVAARKAGHGATPGTETAHLAHSYVPIRRPGGAETARKVTK